MRLEFYDAERRFTLCRLKQYIKQEEDILTRAQAGEERYSGNLGWLHVDEWAGEEKLREIETCAGRVREDGEILVVIGIGGSNQAARAVVEALSCGGPMKILYAGNNVSSQYMKQLLKQLEGKSVYVNVIAKNFETLEPGIGFRILRQ